MKRIKDLPEFSRPREKMIQGGASLLSDTELIAVMIGSGTKGQDVMRLSSKIAKIISERKAELTLEMLTRINGMGLAKSAQILAGMELARRHLMKSSTKITQAKDALPLLNDITNKLQEYFVCLSLNGANELIEKRIVTVGLLNQSQVHPREVFADVITDRAASVILSHNHPSGQLQPSANDLNIHKQLKEAGKILGITVLDHIIVSRNGYYSFQENGLA